MSSREPPSSMVLNFDDIETKRRFMAKVGQLRGLHEITIKPRRKTRSLQANAYYWSAYIPGWLEWLREQSGEPWITKEQAHEALKKHVLGTTPIINKETGELIDEMIPDSRFMDTREFGEYLDRAAEFLATFCGIAVVSSDMYFEGATGKES